MALSRNKSAMKYNSLFYLLFTTILIGLLVTAFLQFWPHFLEEKAQGIPSVDQFGIFPGSYKAEVVLNNSSDLTKKHDQSCLFHTCFDVYQCGYNDDNRISVYIYPQYKYTDENGVPIALPMSKEFMEILQTVMDSIYFSPDPDRACIFLPPIDMLNQNNIRLQESSRILANLPRWNDGINHLLFNMLPGSTPDYNTTLDVHHDKAMVAGGGYSLSTYRSNFDVAIPIFNPLVADARLAEKPYLEERPWLLVSAQFGYHPEYRDELNQLADKMHDFLLLDKCGSGNYSIRCRGGDVYDYPYILQESTFCLVIRGARLGQMIFSDILMSGCIPIVVADGFVLPFSEVIDWKRAAIVVREDDLGMIGSIASKVSTHKIHEMRKQVHFLWETYFSSMRAITLTTLQIINDRVFPYAARKYEEWNEPPFRPGVANPLFLPLQPSTQQGFTAVILTFDRLELLFKVIHQVARVPSLSKILVVWNNQIKAPPQASVWPKINKPLKVVQTRQNKLSNRFYPYDEIETEAILALDDDILMLTPDEIEFGYQVWQEFPDRLVGFPSRLHLLDNGTHRWKYESEWTSEISIVLTGAAFHHKYFSFLYTNSMPGDIKVWVDQHMNCEDIAMNFLIANATGKAPIKVAPRQKFRCPECSNIAMLSADLTHMVERSDCVNRFAKIYGVMPLKTIEFRADPVLYKDNMPTKLKRFNDIGSL